MPNRARRLPARFWHGFMRRALLMLCVWHAGYAAADTSYIVEARYAQPTKAYPHGVLGDDVEWAQLLLVTSGERDRTIRLSAAPDSVFEDIAPRLWDLTGDGQPEVVAVESHKDLGARLVVFGLVNGASARIAMTPHIGQRFRWLAPIGAADFDDDGHVEIAFVDRPHLARVLRVWRFVDGAFSEVTTVSGVSNHRIGQDFISGGIRNCGAGYEIIVANADWSAIVAARLQAGGLMTRQLDERATPRGFATALACREN